MAWSPLSFSAFGYPGGVYGVAPGYPPIPELGRTFPVPDFGRTYPLPFARANRPRSPLSSDVFRVDGLVRTYYVNDQRIEWSGNEDTFGAEAALRPQYIHQDDGWAFQVNSEFFLNEPLDANVMVDANRQSYVADFQTPPFQIWELNMRLVKGDWAITLGKAPTPFGRYYFPILSNSRFDAPFIRTEAIQFQETGLFVHYQPGRLVLDAAITNGGQNRDTNSSKALVARAGLQTDTMACGVSIKAQDGVGSEMQKEFDSFAGFDAMWRFGDFILSTEAIYDEYGFKSPYNPQDIFWGRDLYGRDSYAGNKKPIHGIGYYVDLTWRRGRWTTDLNYGEFYPQQIGVPAQDAMTRRGICKLIFNFTKAVQGFGMLLVENQRPLETWQIGQQPYAVYGGFQFFL